MKNDLISWKTDDMACKSEGKRQAQEPTMEAVPYVIHAAMIWPWEPVEFWMPMICVRWKGCANSAARIGQAVFWIVFPKPISTRATTNMSYLTAVVCSATPSSTRIEPIAIGFASSEPLYQWRAYEQGG